ncbi:MAG: hypothetical protein RMJ52_17660 [Gemmataceae bacterium]|nr:hypothetical protein [Gemmataceae bacterium]
MRASASIFLSFNLPDAATWFYLTLVLAIALFFKFGRLLSMRNWDVVTLFLAIPGFLLLLDARQTGSNSLQWCGYLWLMAASVIYFGRCLVDLTLIARPALAPNLSLGGLGWLAGALFVGLGAVAARQPSERPDPDSQAPAPIDKVQRQGRQLLHQQVPALGADETTVQLWVGRSLALVCHLMIVSGLIVVGCRHFQDVHAGMAAATFYLLLPYVYLLMPGTALHLGRWYHLLPMALLVWAVVFYRWPMLAGLFVGLSVGSVYFPVFLAPLWASFYRGRGAGRFSTVLVLTAAGCLSLTALVLWLDGDLAQSWQHAWDLTDWQPWKDPVAEGLWTRLPWAMAYRLPVFILYLAFVLTTAFWPSPKNLAHLLALSAAILIGVQFWYADKGGAYVLWYLPFLLLLVFRPNLSDRAPPPIVPEQDRLLRLGQAVARWVRSWVRLPEPLVRLRG